MMHVYFNCKNNAYDKPAVKVALFKTFGPKDLSISMASLLKYFNFCWLFG